MTGNDRTVFRFILLSIVAVPVFFASCRQEKVENRVSLASLEVDAGAGSQFMDIESSTGWSIQFGNDAGQWCSVSPSSGSGSHNNVVLSYSGNTGEEVREATIIVVFDDGESVMSKLRQKGVSGTGESDPENPDGSHSGLVSDPVYEWMELPSVREQEGYVYVFHHAEAGGREVRNYSMYYDAGNRIALWVAYPLCNMYTGSSGRTDDWNYDPKIPSEYQPQLFRGWPEKGYDRGHQIPSGSRNENRPLNSQTFYFTNMTAQISSFNQGLWAEVENRVRGYSSSCDTLYVVTGPLLSTSGDPETDYTVDNAGAKVALPKAYFKVLLKRNVVEDTYYSIAYYYENRKYDRSSPEKGDLRRVSEIEDMTGITFFANLPDNIENEVKNQFDPVRWGF